MISTARPATAADGSFLTEVFAQSREAEFAGLSADPALLATVIAQQYRAQRAAYTAQHPGAVRFVITDGDAAIGSMEVDRSGPTWHLLDIAVLTDQRGRGYGTHVLGTLLAEADAAGVAVELHVNPWNPARRLYERLGFVVTQEEPTRLRLRRSPASVSRS